MPLRRTGPIQDMIFSLGGFLLLESCLGVLACFNHAIWGDSLSLGKVPCSTLCVLDSLRLIWRGPWRSLVSSGERLVRVLKEFLRRVAAEILVPCSFEEFTKARRS